MTQKRCHWCGTDPLYVDYHDHIWGRPVADSRELFEKLCLDGQQAGLSWITILRKQKNYEEAYAGFQPEILATWGEKEVEALLQNAGIVRNKLKVWSVIKNARAYQKIEEQSHLPSGQAFSYFLWKFLDGKPQTNHFSAMEDIPTSTEISDLMSKALKKAGFSFVGTTIVYAFMQAVGMVNDHLTNCPQHSQCQIQGEGFKL